MTDKLFCKDCDHYRYRLTTSDICVSPEQETDIVSGEIRTDYCYSNRMSGRSCGPDAKWFEPKRNFLKRIFG